MYIYRYIDRWISINNTYITCSHWSSKTARKDSYEKENKTTGFDLSKEICMHLCV